MRPEVAECHDHPGGSRHLPGSGTAYFHVPTTGRSPTVATPTGSWEPSLSHRTIQHWTAWSAPTQLARDGWHVLHTCVALGRDMGSSHEYLISPRQNLVGFSIFLHGHGMSAPRT